MGCHLGWHFAEGCPLRGGRGEYVYTIGTYVPPKIIKEKKKKIYSASKQRYPPPCQHCILHSNQHYLIPVCSSPRRFEQRFSFLGQYCKIPFIQHYSTLFGTSPAYFCIITSCSNAPLAVLKGREIILSFDGNIKGP
jgi:hypothetical protein